MYLHIGGDKAIAEEDILFILPKQTLRESRDTRRFMENILGGGRVQEVYGGGDTYVIAEGEQRTEVYLTPVAAATLLARKTN